MWILFAFASAFFAGMTSVLAKIGLQKTDSNLATALRTIVVLIFAWFIVIYSGVFDEVWEISHKSLLFLVLSGITTGASWICYFKALQIGDVSKVVPVDKSSTIITMILAFLILREPVAMNMLLGMIIIGAGTYLMILKKNDSKNNSKNNSKNGESAFPEETGKKSNLTDQKSERKSNLINQKWLIFAFLSALFAALTAILAKIGIEDVDSNLGTAVRTVVVLIMAWIVVFYSGKQKDILNIDRKSWVFIILSGLTTGLSWLFFFGALKDGLAGVVVPIDKLSILVTVAFAFVFLKERMTKKYWFGLLLLTAGTLLLLVQF
ncbi:MAG: EamA family transporter [Methanimicrococcus sp.]|nr:EamA family transporter [Methanimicrococcus sp.]